MATREFIGMPDTIKQLPRDRRGYPVPAFAYWDEDGEPDFRVIKPRWPERCVKQNLCWICGCGMGRKRWFVLSPMCTITNTTSEPPCHKTCAEFAAKHCPFLATPMAKRSTKPMPVDDPFMPGDGITRNPGVCVIWETLTYKRFPDGKGHWLIEIGPPENATFWREGRKATRDEVLESVVSGLPALKELAAKQGAHAEYELGQVVGRWVGNVLERYVAADDPPSLV